jgi:hypothetical protein
MADRDRDDVVTRLLQRDRRQGWHVVKPEPGEVDGFVVLQNKAGKKVVALISHEDVNDLSDDELLKRIRTTIFESSRS